MSERIVARPRLAAPPATAYRSHEVHPRAFTVRQCERILGLGEQLERDAAVLEDRDGGEVADGAIRRSRTAWIPVAEDTWWIYERLAAVVERANRRYRFDLTGFDEDLQLTYYDEPGSFYDWHQDGLDGTVGGRKLSVVVQLSDPAGYEGGELELFDVSVDLEGDARAELDQRCRARGTAVVFPAFEYHRVRPIRRGERASLVAWVSGPPFR